MDASLVRTVDTFPDGRQEAYLGNGMLGYRIKPNPFASWKAVASGFVKEDENGLFEALAYAPYPFGMDFRLGRSHLMVGDGAGVRTVRQSLDMSCGELVTEMQFTVGSGVATARVLQFISRTCPVISCQEVRLTLPSPGELTVVSSLVCGPGNSMCRNMPPGNENVVDLMLGYGANGHASSCGVSVKIDIEGAPAVRQGFEADSARASRHFRVDASLGKEVVIRTIAATVTSAYHPQPDLESCRLANWGAALGFDKLRLLNREAWRSIWRSRVVVTGDEKAQRYLDCALYYLFSSAHESCRTSIPPFGVSQAANYSGHVFWDTDTYMTPALLLTSPAAAKATVDYRFRNLEAARQRAQCYGYRGAMYPWESDTRGFESTPSGCGTGWLEQHVNMCVAFAAWQYQQATGDLDYARECVWPIVSAVAEWVESRVEETEQGYGIAEVMSADESKGVSNSSYVNALAAEALRIACRCAELAGKRPGESWAGIAERMYIPMGRAPEGSGVIGQVILMHEGGFEENASVDSFMVGFPFDLPFERDLLRRTYEFAMALKQDVVCMGHCFFAGEAAFVGSREGARALFDRVIDETTEPAWGMGTEYTNADTTCFVTTMGGMLQTAMMAFTGLRFDPGNWTRYEVCLPEGWTKIEVDRIHLGGRAYHLEARHGRKAVLTEIGQ